jgi:hypothetical protein
MCAWPVTLTHQASDARATRPGRRAIRRWADELFHPNALGRSTEGS